MNKRFYVFVCMILTAVIAVVIIGSRSVRSSAQNNDICEKNVSYISYQIQPNDTLWELGALNAADCGFTVQEYIREVQSINRMKGSKIIAGNYLILPTAVQ